MSKQPVGLVPAATGRAAAKRMRPLLVLAALIAASSGAAFWLLNADARRTDEGDRQASSDPVEDSQTTSNEGSLAGRESNRPSDSHEGSVGQTGELETQDVQRSREARVDSLNAGLDGWDSEVVAEATNAGYARIASWLRRPAGPTADELEQFVSEDFTCSPLRPAQTEKVYSDGGIRVVRGGAQASPPPRQQGPSGFLSALMPILTDLDTQDERHVKFKQFRIDPGPDVVRTTAYFHAFATTSGGPVEINSTWDCAWRPDASGGFRLSRIDVSEFEEVAIEIDTPTAFSDCTEAVLGDVASYRERLLHGVGYWRQRLASNLNLQYHGHIGLAVGDVNGDELDDVYLCQPGGLPNVLFVRQPDGTVRDVASESGVDILNYTRGALFVDLDNDGDQDLVLTIIEQVAVYENDGRGNFKPRAGFPKIQGAYSISAADVDNDRDLDLYVCRHRADGHDKGEFPVPYPYYDANNGGQNYFLRNEGDWRFVDATEELGLDKHNTRFSFASSWEDYDQDGDLDLYVANDFGRNTLYRNEGGRFASVSEQAGLEDTAFGMSVSWGDYDRDGLMDIYVGNMFSAAGNRITFQDQFRPESTDEDRAKYQRTARGNSLFRNQGDGTFQDVSTEAAVTVGRWSWASLFADINNDGWEDLLVTNGFVTGDTIDDL